MMAVRTTLTASNLPDNLKAVRTAIEKAVPRGRTEHGGKGDRGAWGNPPGTVLDEWRGRLERNFIDIVSKYPHLAQSNNLNHLGTLGTGNHFIEICLDEEDKV